ncbi:MAG: molybdopterin converting factor subunit 1 [Pseudomonadota bacterium]|nr:molybdopterin converting factor subunit 1 [Pseudomonadota bacterium]
MLTIRFFARLREETGSAERAVELPREGLTVAQLRGWLRGQDARLAAALDDGRAVRTALNRRMCNGDATVQDGDEVAFFPPVTGG